MVLVEGPNNQRGCECRTGYGHWVLPRLCTRLVVSVSLWLLSKNQWSLGLVWNGELGLVERKAEGDTQRTPTPILWEMRFGSLQEHVTCSPPLFYFKPFFLLSDSRDFGITIALSSQSQQRPLYRINPTKTACVYITLTVPSLEQVCYYTIQFSRYRLARFSLPLPFRFFAFDLTPASLSTFHTHWSI